jgi:hypothetical protein
VVTKDSHNERIDSSSLIIYRGLCAHENSCGRNLYYVKYASVAGVSCSDNIVSLFCWV